MSKDKRRYKQAGALNKESKDYKPSHETSAIRKWMMELCDYETLCTDLIRPLDPMAIKPILRKVESPLDRTIYSYFRVLLSSQDQNIWTNAIARVNEWMVFDEVSGGFLGLYSVVSSDLPWGPFSEWAGGQVGVDARREGHNTHHTVVTMKRCLPLYDFGQLTGGKLLALLATSTEPLTMYELKFTLPVNAFIIKTLHGKSSQYNRLHARGIEWRGVAKDGAGFYVMLCREHGKEHMLEQVPDPGARLTYSMQEQVDYWKERWLPNRLDKLTNGMMIPDPVSYRLSDKMPELLARRHAQNSIEKGGLKSSEEPAKIPYPQGGSDSAGNHHEIEEAQG